MAEFSHRCNFFEITLHRLAWHQDLVCGRLSRTLEVLISKAAHKAHPGSDVDFRPFGVHDARRSAALDQNERQLMLRCCLSHALELLATSDVVGSDEGREEASRCCYNTPHSSERESHGQVYVCRLETNKALGTLIL